MKFKNQKYGLLKKDNTLLPINEVFPKDPFSYGMRFIDELNFIIL